MFVFKHMAAVAAVVSVGALAAPAQANVITFDTTSLGAVIFPVTEDGFTYSLDNGSLTINDEGNPGQDIETQVTGGGVLEIVSAGAPDFVFNSTDFAAIGVIDTSRTLTVEGLLGGSLVATDMFTVPDSDFGNPHWFTEPASNLQGQTIDELLITLDGNDALNTIPLIEGVDNVVLTPVTAVPEPATWAMMLLGVGGIGAALRLGRRPAPGQAAIA